MRVRSLHYLILLLAFPLINACSARELTDVELLWTIDDNGSLIAHPRPDDVNTRREADSKEAILPPAKSIIDLFESPKAMRTVSFSGIHYIQFLLHGGLDLASLTDADRHFNKLNSDTQHRLDLILKSPLRDLTPALKARWDLDRLLAVRLSGTAWTAAIKDALSKTAIDEKADPFLRQAAHPV